MANTFFRLIKISVQWACVGHCFCEYIGDIVMCAGPSMEPTLKENNIVYCDTLITRFRGVRAGDIVISRSVHNPELHICKRVIGLNGDIVWSGSKYVQIPLGHIWLQGDNKSNSNDSRHYGPVPLALIKYRVICVLWPLNSFRIFTGFPPS